MRTDLVPLCDEHYRAMEPTVAPLDVATSIEFYRCSEQFCQRCFSEALGYVTRVKGAPPVYVSNQPRCSEHDRPMFVSGIDRQRNVRRYACPEPGCPKTTAEDIG